MTSIEEKLLSTLNNLILACRWSIDTDPDPELEREVELAEKALNEVENLK